MKEDWIYLMATAKNERLYIRVVPAKLELVTDFLFDHGCIVGTCAAWFWLMQASNKEHPQYDAEGSVWEIDEDTHELRFFAGEE